MTGKLKEIKTRRISETSGITLITLVVTIIVLLILTGISISAFIGQNDILNEAEEAKETTKETTLKEEVELYILEINIVLFKDSNFAIDGAIDLEDIPVKFNGDEPNIGWIYVKNKTITKYEFYFDEYYILSVNGTTIVKKFEFSNLINVKDFGATGDGVTDDTKAIQVAVEFLNNNGGILYFPIGTYNISVTSEGESVITLQSNKEIIIDFFVSTIVLQPNKYKSYNIINVNKCSSVEIRNGFLVGDRTEHDYTTIESTHEFGYGVFLGQTTGGTVFNMEISDMTGDAIINKNGESGGTINISECNLHHCRRQGISILDSDIIKIDNTEIHHIGTFDNVTGTAPMSGIDIEPASGTKSVNQVNIDNVKIYETSSYGLICNNKSVMEVNITNSESNDISLVCNYAQIANTTITYNLNLSYVLENINLEDSKINCESIKTMYYSNSSINNCILENTELNTLSRIFFSGTVSVNNSTFKNFIGNENKATSASRTNFGIVIDTDTDWSDSNNIWENCALFLSAILESNDSSATNSYIYCSNEMTLNNWKITNSTTGSSSLATITLKDCDIRNSGTFGSCIKYISNTYWLMEDIINGNFRDGSTCDNSILVVTNSMNRYALNYIIFSNESKIVLEKYSDIRVLPNLYSTEGTDYSVEYNGTETL